ncbi:MAG: alpha/beta hydrolase, partial [Anaerolineae bacterium]|nr:alpha/beta hydrolase [Anaerolineae bacterium]
PLPVLFMIHGGGYVFGSKTILAPYAEYFAELGYAAVVPNYRLAPDAPYPIPLQDLFCALAWTYREASRYGLESARVVLIGESAGGNAAALLASVDDPNRFLNDCAYAFDPDDRPQALITYYMYSDLLTCAEEACSLVRYASGLYLDTDLTALEGDDLLAAWGDASPITWLNGDEPPTLVIHGLADMIVPYTESIRWAEALERYKIPVQTLLIEDAPHGFIEKFRVTGSIEARDAVEAFLAALP